MECGPCCDQADEGRIEDEIDSKDPGQRRRADREGFKDVEEMKCVAAYIQLKLELEKQEIESCGHVCLLSHGGDSIQRLSHTSIPSAMKRHTSCIHLCVWAAIVEYTTFPSYKTPFVSVQPFRSTT
jgi:hypothetical protein